METREAGDGFWNFPAREYMVRGHGYAKSIEDLEEIVVATDQKRDAPAGQEPGHGRHRAGDPRWPADLDGEGDVVGTDGHAAFRLKTPSMSSTRVKAKRKEIEHTLPEGTEIKVTYDRSELILKAIETLKHQLIEEMIIVSFVILIFLWHFLPRSSRSRLSRLPFYCRLFLFMA